MRNSQTENHGTAFPSELDWMCVVFLTTAIALTAGRARSDLPKAQPRLPSARKLISEVEFAHSAYEAESGSCVDQCLAELAQAKAWLGDIDGALATVRRIDGLWSDIYASSCAEIHFKLTGKVLEIPAREFKQTLTADILYAHDQLKLAKRFYSLGRSEESDAYLPNDDGQIAVTVLLTEFQLHAGQTDLQNGDIRSARNRFQRCLGFLQRHPDRRPYKQGEWFIDTARGLLETRDRRAAQTCRGLFADSLDFFLRPEQLERYNGTTAPDEHLAKSWARLAIIDSLLNERDSAERVFRRSLDLLNQSRTVSSDQPERFADLHLGNYLKSLLQIGVWQVESGFTDEGKASIRRVVELSGEFASELTRQSMLKDTIDRCCEVGDVETALDTVAHQKTPYWRAISLCSIADAQWRLEDADRSSASLDEAVELAGGEADPNNATAMWIEIAESQSFAHKKQASQSALRAALKVSNATESKRFHQRICFCQIRLGHHSDAWITLKHMADGRHKLWPYAKLAKEVAEAHATREKEHRAHEDR